jgi:hypothetical protein
VQREPWREAHQAWISTFFSHFALVRRAAKAEGDAFDTTTATLPESLASVARFRASMTEWRRP